MDIGTTLADTLRIFAKAPFAFVGLTVLPAAVSLPFWIVMLLVSSHQLPLAWHVSLTILDLAVQLVCLSAIFVAAADVADYGYFDIGSALATGVRRLVPFAVTIVIVVLAVAAGTLLLVVPGVIVALASSVALPACVIEDLGPIASLQRSLALTRAHLWQIFGLLLVALVALAVLFGGLAFILIVGEIKLAILPILAMTLAVGPMSVILLSALFLALRTASETKPLRGSVVSRI